MGIIILVSLLCLLGNTAKASPTSIYGGASFSGPGFYINSNGQSFFTGIHLYMNPYSTFRVAAVKPVVPTNYQTLQNVMEYAEIKRMAWLESKKTALLPPPAPVPYVPLEDIPPLTTSEKE